MSNPGVSNCYVFKSRLQEYAQKVGLPTPVYETVKEGPSHQPSFRSTVVLDDLRYDSLLGFFNRKAAEQSAAEVALMELANIGKLNDCVSQPVQETGLCKNLLQEYAQKMNYAIPLYVCQRDESQGRVILFSCTVDIGGMKYIGAAAKTKKEAEIKAARTALLAIQSSPGSNETSTGNSVYTVVPSKKMGTDPGISTPENLKPKKGLFKKKPHRKRRDGKKGNSMAMGHLGLGIDIGGHEGQQMAQTANSELSSMEAAMNPEGGPKSELSSVEATMNLEGGPKSELSSVEATMNPEGGPIYNGNEVEISATEESDMVPCNNVDSKDGKLQDLSMEATMNPEGRPVYSANEVEEFATEESDTEEFATEEGRPVACSNVDPVDGKLQDLGFCVSVLKNPNGGDSTSEVSGVKQNSCNSGGGFDGEQLQDLGFCVSVLKNPNGGDSTSEVSEVKQNSCNSGGGFDGKQLFFPCVHVSGRRT